ncbi:MAG TPA: hypothetical protein VGF55_06030 [Gemmataceae bacterium]|jgi:hypothetical protein
MRLYLDLCCLYRPFDDQSQARIHLEAEAVILILDACQAGRHEFCSSTPLDVENGRNPDADRRDKVSAVIARAAHRIPHAGAISDRVLQLVPLGFQEFDAYHLASAEAGRCDRLVTTDDRFLRAAARNSGTIGVQVTDPVRLIAEADF